MLLGSNSIVKLQLARANPFTSDSFVCRNLCTRVLNGNSLLAWSNESTIRSELEVVFLVPDLQTVVNSIVRNCIRLRSTRVEGTLEVMRYLMRHELSVRPDFPRHHDFVSAGELSVPGVTPLKNESSLSARAPSLASPRDRLQSKSDSINYSKGKAIVTGDKIEKISRFFKTTMLLDYSAFEACHLS